MRRSSLFLVLLAVLALTFSVQMQGQSANSNENEERSAFNLVETTISDTQHAYRSGLLTPEQLVQMYQARIAAYDGLDTGPIFPAICI